MPLRGDGCARVAPQPRAEPGGVPQALHAVPVIGGKRRLAWILWVSVSYSPLGVTGLAALLSPAPQHLHRPRTRTGAVEDQQSPTGSSIDPGGRRRRGMLLDRRPHSARSCFVKSRIPTAASNQARCDCDRARNATHPERTITNTANANPWPTCPRCPLLPQPSSNVQRPSRQRHRCSSHTGKCHPRPSRQRHRRSSHTGKRHPRHCRHCRRHCHHCRPIPSRRRSIPAPHPKSGLRTSTR